MSFEIIRPTGLLSNTILISDKRTIGFKPIMRSGTGDYDINRPVVLSDPILPRQILDFDIARAMDVEQSGVLVQLSDKTLQKLFNIEVDDMGDVQWITEYNRRKLAGETDEQIRARPPYSRPQRKISKNVNFAQSNLKLDEKIDLMKTAIDSGTANNRVDLTAIGVQLTALLAGGVNLANMTQTEFTKITDILNHMSMPPTYQLAKLPYRFYLLDGVLHNPMVNLFLLSNIPPHLSSYLPVSIADPTTGSTTPITLEKMYRILKKVKPYYCLDIELRRVRPLSEVIVLVNAGEDGGKLNGHDIPLTGWDYDDISGTTNVDFIYNP